MSFLLRYLHEVTAVFGPRPDTTAYSMSMMPMATQKMNLVIQDSMQWLATQVKQPGATFNTKFS